MYHFYVRQFWVQSTSTFQYGVYFLFHPIQSLSTYVLLFIPICIPICNKNFMSFNESRSCLRECAPFKYNRIPMRRLPRRKLQTSQLISILFLFINQNQTCPTTFAVHRAHFPNLTFIMIYYSVSFVESIQDLNFHESVKLIPPYRPWEKC